MAWMCSIDGWLSIGPVIWDYSFFGNRYMDILSMGALGVKVMGVLKDRGVEIWFSHGGYSLLLVGFAC